MIFVNLNVVGNVFLGWIIFFNLSNLVFGIFIIFILGLIVVNG